MIDKEQTDSEVGANGEMDWKVPTLYQAVLARAGNHPAVDEAALSESLARLFAFNSSSQAGQQPDWQRLAGALTGEPWFGETFDDMRTMVGTDAGRVVYLTVFTRCAPGTCRVPSARI